MTRADCPDPLALPDGAEVCVRPLEPGESLAVEGVFESLGERSRRERFHGPKTRLSDAELGRITAVDHRTRDALLAVDMETDRPLALFEVVRDSEGSDVGEVAFAVADDWQGRGLGRALAERLAARARCLSLTRLRAHVVASNERALAVVRRMGRVASSRVEGGGYEIEIALTRED